VSKFDLTEQTLERLSALKSNADDATIAKEVKTHLSNRSNLVIAKAAQIARERGTTGLLQELTAAFQKLMKDPQRLDKRCAALTQIALALYEMDYQDSDVYLKGMRHVQMEGSFGPPVDFAAALRGICAQGLVRTQRAGALGEVVSLLVDPEVPARVGAVRALATNGGEAGALVLRLKALMGDADIEVMAECFSGLLAAGEYSSLEFVARYVDADEIEISEAAILALGGSRLPKAVDVLKHKLERTVQRPLRKTLLLALATSRDEGAINFLLSLIESAQADAASDVISALALHKSSESVRHKVNAAIERRGDESLVEAFRREFGE
jgi:HEAT repeat protein